MTDEEDETSKKIFQLFQNGPPEKTEEKAIPELDYVVVDVDDNEFVVNGFVVFTTQHFAVMRDGPNGTLPVIVMPLNRLKYAGLDEEIGDQEVFPDLSD